MARFAEPSAEELAAWAAWVAERPANVRAVAARFDPWTLYRLRSTSSRVTLVSFGEHADKSVTLTVAVTGEYNLVAFERSVFGIDPADLEPCEFPGPDEPVGVFSSAGDVEAFFRARQP